MLAGVDEAGCGALMGDLVAAAVCLPDAFDTTGIADSKRLSAKKRNALCARIRRDAHVGVGVVTLDEINATCSAPGKGFGDVRRLVFQRAVAALVGSVTPTKIIVDGTGFFDGHADIPFECVARADATYSCVSAASIVAKTLRDEAVLRVCECDAALAERFGWPQNKGYPTAQHLAAIRAHGITAHHRASFGPCARALGS